MPQKKDADSIKYYQTISKKKTKLFYNGERELDVLEHRAYGTFYINEDDSSFDLPKPYAQILLEKSPHLFSAKPLKKKKLPYDELLKKAEAKAAELGVALESRKAVELEKFLNDNA